MSYNPQPTPTYVSNGTYAYKIGSSAGKAIADSMPVGGTYNASDGSTWTKNGDGTISVLTKGGTYTSNAYQSYVPLSGSSSVPAGGSDTANNVDNSSSILEYVKDLLKDVQSTNASSNSLAIDEAQKNRDWQEEMSNTAHQREVVDLKAAGLNPVLSASGGNGAPVTSGSTADIKDVSSSMSSLAGAAIGALAQIANTQANNAKDIAINQKNLDVQTMLGLKDLDLRQLLGLAGLDLEKYGIDMNYINTREYTSATRYAADISKLNNDLQQFEAYRRLERQGEIDLSKITSQGDVDILKSIFSSSGIHGEKDYINQAIALAYLASKGIILTTNPDDVKDATKSSSGRFSHHR